MFNKIHNEKKICAAFAAQLFLMISFIWLVGVLYRWESLRSSMAAHKIAVAFFDFLPFFFIFAFLAGLFLRVCLIALNRRRPAWKPYLMVFARVISLALFAYLIFRSLFLWGDKIGHLAGDYVKAAALVLLFVVLAVFWFARRMYKTGKFGDLDRVQTAAINIFLFALMMLIVALTSVVIENRLTYKLKPLFEQYGFILTLFFFFLHRKEIARAMNNARATIIPALALLFLSSGVLVYSFLNDGAGARIEILADSASRADKYNIEHVILISFDGLAANRMSLYGNPRQTTPNIERFAEISHVFDRAHANNDSTEFSIPSIHIGILPYTTARFKRVGKYFAGGDIVGYMPTVFKQLGWDTVYLLFQPGEGVDDIFRRILPYNDAPLVFLKEYYGNALRRYLQKFALKYSFLPAFALEGIYSDFKGTHKTTGELEWDGDFPGRPKFNLAKEYLMENYSRNNFLWMHLWPPHHPYSRFNSHKGVFLDDPVEIDEVESALEYNGPPYAPEKQPLVEKFKLIYEEYVLATDAQFGIFFDFLKENGFLENSMIIVTSDHGQAFDKGQLYHGGGLMHEQTMRVPLIIHMPGQAKGERIYELAQLADIAPTILGTLGQKAPDWMDGKSLLAYMEDEQTRQVEYVPKRITFGQNIPTVTRLIDIDYLEHLYTFVVYKGNYKLIYRFFADFYLQEIPVKPGTPFERLLQNYSQIELFNLTNDPEEKLNLIDKEPEIAAELMRLAQGQIEKNRAFRGQSF